MLATRVPPQFLAQILKGVQDNEEVADCGGRETDPLLPASHLDRTSKNPESLRGASRQRSISRSYIAAAEEGLEEIGYHAEHTQEETLLWHERASRQAGKSYWVMGDPDSHRHRVARTDDVEGEINIEAGASSYTQRGTLGRSALSQGHQTISVYDEGRHLIVEDEEGLMVHVRE